MELEKEPGQTIAPCQLRPESRGSVHCKSADPAANPAILANYLADPLAGYIDHETNPGVDVESDEDLLAYARQQGTTIYHPVGTCAMGRHETAVVDPELR